MDSFDITGGLESWTKDVDPEFPIYQLYTEIVLILNVQFTGINLNIVDPDFPNLLVNFILNPGSFQSI